MFSRHFYREIILLAILLIGYTGLHGVLFTFYTLPPEMYRSFSIVIAGIQWPPFTVILIIPPAVLLIAREESSWDSFEYGDELRLFILAIAFPLLWYHITYNFNFFLDQPHHLDRIILLGVYMLIWVHPLFSYLFITVLLVMIGQFEYPFGFMSVTDRLLPINLIILFSAFLFLQLRYVDSIQRLLHRVGLKILSESNEFRSKIFLWLATVIIGRHYFMPGLTKLSMLWPLRERLDFLILKYYQVGWLGQLKQSTILEISSAVQLLNPLMVAVAIVIELSGVFLMWRRKISTVVITGFVILHTGIFIASGIAFWMWAVVDVIFLLFVFVLDNRNNDTIYTDKTVAVVTVLILLSPLIIPTNATVSSYHNNYQESYSINAISSSGKSYEVHWSKMEPYVHTFASQRLEYINDEEEISGVSTNYTRAKHLRSATSIADLERLKNQYGVNYYDKQRAMVFDCFIHQYFTNRFDRQGGKLVWTKIPKLPHFWSTESMESIPREDNITHIQIKREVYIFNNKSLKKSEDIIREVSLRPESKYHGGCKVSTGIGRKSPPISSIFTNNSSESK
jgi:hypothetical protein